MKGIKKEASGHVRGRASARGRPGTAPLEMTFRPIEDRPFHFINQLLICVPEPVTAHDGPRTLGQNIYAPCLLCPKPLSADCSGEAVSNPQRCEKCLRVRPV